VESDQLFRKRYQHQNTILQSIITHWRRFHKTTCSQRKLLTLICHTETTRTLTRSQL